MESDIQVENGNYTRIHNDILDILAKTRLAPLEFALVTVIFRKTYGYQKKDDVISTAQFCEATGASKTGIIEALNNLVRLRMIYREPVGQMYSYGFNKYYDQWLPEVYISRRAGQTKNFGDKCRSKKWKTGQPMEEQPDNPRSTSKATETGQPMENRAGQVVENKTGQPMEDTQKKERKLKKLTPTESKDSSGVAKPEVQKPEPNRDDPGYWKFLKENAQYGWEFYKASGYFPVGKQFSLWQEGCRELREAGITPETVPKAVKTMLDRGLTIKSPKSILAVAREIMNKNSRSEDTGWKRAN